MQRRCNEMTNKNTRSKGEYALDHILWGLISWLWFTKSLFRNIEGLSYDRSRLVLLGTLTASILLGLAVTWKRRRNNLSLFVNLVLPYEIYTLIVYRETAPVLIRILIITSVCLSVIYAVLVLRPHIRVGARKAVVLWRRLTHSALGIRTIAACCLSVLLLALGASAVFGIAFFSPSTAADNPLDHEEVTLEENIDVVSRLDEDTWVQLSSREKLDALQTVANIEACYFGLPHALNVISGNLEHNILACYNDQIHLITIDLHHLEYDSARSVLKSLCHEARHAYQHRLCDVYDGTAETQKTLLLFRSVQCFRQEFSNYVEGSDDSMEEMADAIQACLNAWYTEMTGKEPPESPTARDREFMQRTTATMQTFLGSVAWQYETITLQDDYALYEIDDLFDGVRLRAQIHVQTGPRVCRLSVILPVMADAALEYPLCRALVRENFTNAIGTFKYDERDGTIRYEYCFFIQHELFEDDLDTCLHAVIRAALSGYENIRRCCTGDFEAAEAEEIRKKANALVRALSE